MRLHTAGKTQGIYNPLVARISKWRRFPGAAAQYLASPPTTTINWHVAQYDK